MKLSLATLVLTMAAVVAAGENLSSPQAKQTAVDDLLGTFVVEGEGMNGLLLRVSKEAGSYFVSTNPGGRWNPPIKVRVGGNEQLVKENVFAVLLIEGKSGDDSGSVSKVPVGWKSHSFQSKTGYVLSTFMGMFDLRKTAREAA